MYICFIKNELVFTYTVDSPFHDYRYWPRKPRIRDTREKVLYRLPISVITDARNGESTAYINMCILGRLSINSL